MSALTSKINDIVTEYENINRKLFSTFLSDPYDYRVIDYYYRTYGFDGTYFVELEDLILTLIIIQYKYNGGTKLKDLITFLEENLEFLKDLQAQGYTVEEFLLLEYLKYLGYTVEELPTLIDDLNSLGYTVTY
jgi:hypothetical protein